MNENLPTYRHSNNPSVGTYQTIFYADYADLMVCYEKVRGTKISYNIILL
jgi:hypothetical protein